MNEISRYYNSFSGTDTLAFMLLPGAPPITLGALTTISYSVYRDKKPVNVMGNINVKGFTRGTRVVAGTLVFTLINRHWVKEVAEHCGWLGSFDKLKADELPLFDIMIVSANEYGATASMFIYGIDITDEAQTLSVEDMFTENQFSYIARDVDPFDTKEVYTKESSFKNQKENTGYNTWRVNFDRSAAEPIQINDKDIEAIQARLIDLGYNIEKPTGGLDTSTEREIINFQYNANIPITGYLDEHTKARILRGEYNDNRRIITSDKNGSLVYKNPTTESDIMLQLPYSTQIVVLSKNGEWYEVLEGFIHESNLTIEEEEKTLPNYLFFSIPSGVIVLRETPQEGSYTLKQLLEVFEINILASELSTATVEVVGYYSNGTSSSLKKIYQVYPEINKEIFLKEFHEAFLYKEEHEESPQFSEVFLTINGEVYKWILRKSQESL